MRFTALTTKQIRQWLKDNGFSVGCRLGNEFLYDPTDNYIQVQKNYDDCFDYDFIKCLKKLGLKYDFDCITLSILHELGHHETECDFTEEEWDYDNVYKAFLQCTIKDQHKLNVKYWECETEKVANEWLVDFVKSNPKQVQDLEDIIELAIVY